MDDARTADLAAQNESLRLLREQLDLERRRILIIGDAILDRHIYTEQVGQHRPREPLQTVLELGDTDISTPGGGALMARIAKRLGADVTFCGVVGNDNEGKRLNELLEEDGVHITIGDKVTVDKTPLVTRYYARTLPEQYTATVRLNRNASIDEDTLKALAAQIAPILHPEAFDVILLGNYGRGMIDSRLFANQRLGRSVRQSTPYIVLAGRSCAHDLFEALGNVDLVALDIFELWRTLPSIPWPHLAKTPRPPWLKLGYPPDFSPRTDPKPFAEFAATLMSLCPRTDRFFVNQTLGEALAIERDSDLHGRFRFAGIEPSPWRTLTSITGADTAAATFGALALAQNRPKSKVSPFFGAAYAMKYVSGIQITMKAHETVVLRDGTASNPGSLVEQPDQDLHQGWPLPAVPTEQPGILEREEDVRNAVANVKTCICPLAALSGKKAAGRKFFTWNKTFNNRIEEAVNRLKKTPRDQRLKPIRLWIYGPSGTGKEVLAEEIACRLGCTNAVVKVQPDDTKDPHFSMTSQFRLAYRENRALVLNELDKGLDLEIQQELLTLLDDTRQWFPGLLVVGIASTQQTGNLIPDVRRRFFERRTDAARIDIPPFQDRIDDLPYLLGLALARIRSSGRKVSPPTKLSPAALELFLRAPELVDHFTFTNIESTALYLSSALATTGSIRVDQMAEALMLSDEYIGRLSQLVPVFGNEDEPDICIDYPEYDELLQKPCSP